MLTKQQVEKIVKIINEHKDAILFLAVGKKIGTEKIADLKKKGVIAKDVSEDLVKNAYVFGLLANKHPNASFEEIVKEIEGFLPGKIEEGTIEWLQDNAAQYIKGLGNKFEDKTWHIVHDAEKESAMMGIYKDALVQGQKDRLTRSQMVTALRDATKEVTRDQHRVANTELHNARTQGAAKYIRDTFGEDSFVVVKPNTTACKTCRQAYLGPDGKPKIFKLSELSARSNIGKKKAELIAAPGLPTLHPHCACQVIRINPETQEINESGKIVYKKAV